MNSLDIALIKNNAQVAAQIARELSKIKRNEISSRRMAHTNRKAPVKMDTKMIQGI